MEKIFDFVKGLGFTIVRYNIGGDENPALKTLPFRVRMKGFEPAAGQWNWDADAGHRWVLQQAKARGANIFEAFSNSPPLLDDAQQQRHQREERQSKQLDTKHAKDFAEYLATVVEHFKDHEVITFRTLLVPESHSDFVHPI